MHNRVFEIREGRPFSEEEICCKTEEEGWYQFMPIHEFLMYVGEYLTNEGKNPVLYIGKAWDCHW